MASLRWDKRDHVTRTLVGFVTSARRSSNVRCWAYRISDGRELEIAKGPLGRKTTITCDKHLHIEQRKRRGHRRCIRRLRTSGFDGEVDALRCEPMEIDHDPRQRSSLLCAVESMMRTVGSDADLRHACAVFLALSSDPIERTLAREILRALPEPRSAAPAKAPAAIPPGREGGGQTVPACFLV